MGCKSMVNNQYCIFVKQSYYYILNNNYFKFIFQKIFFAMRCLTLCAFVSDVNLVKSFLTFINFDNLFGMEFPFGYKILNYLRRF